MCPFCADQTHWISRCVKIWGATNAGRDFLGADKAAQRARAAFQGMLVGTFAMTAANDVDVDDVFLSFQDDAVCALCDDQAVTYGLCLIFDTSPTLLHLNEVFTDVTNLTHDQIALANDAWDHQRGVIMDHIHLAQTPEAVVPWARFASA